jgi:membrane-bound serine protease (ClpP class)
MTPLIVVLILTGAGLLVTEAHVATYGALGAAGVLALVLAAVLAVGEAGGGALAALAVAIPVAVVLGGLVVVATRKGLAVRQQKVLGGSEGLIGRVGVVRHACAPEGEVFVSGELWHARRSVLHDDDEEPDLREGERVVVERVQGLTLAVRRAEEWEVVP